MKKIFVPTDFSDNAKVALRYALELAKTFNAEIRLFNAYSIPYSGSSVMIDISDVLESNAQEELEKLTEELKDEIGDVKVSVQAIYGPAVETIVANSEGYDLIVMGTHGASGFEGKVLGSIASGVARRAESPVIVLPSGSKPELPKVATISTDLERMPHNEEYFVLNEMANQFKLKLNIVHVSKDLLQVNKDEAKEKFNHDENPLSGLDREFFFCQDNDVEEGIVNHLLAEPTDLLVLVARKRGFFEGLFHKSVSKNVTLHTKTPVLIIHE